MVDKVKVTAMVMVLWIYLQIISLYADNLLKIISMPMILIYIYTVNSFAVNFHADNFRIALCTWKERCH